MESRSPATVSWVRARVSHKGYIPSLSRWERQDNESEASPADLWRCQVREPSHFPATHQWMDNQRYSARHRLGSPEGFDPPGEWVLPACRSRLGWSLSAAALAPA